MNLLSCSAYTGEIRLIIFIAHTNKSIKKCPENASGGV